MGRGYINKHQVLDKLKVGREAVIQVHAQAKINGPEYKAATLALTQIDALAEALTGDPKYFHIKMAPASSQPVRRSD